MPRQSPRLSSAPRSIGPTRPSGAGGRRRPAVAGRDRAGGAASVTSRVPACRIPPCRGDAGDDPPLAAWWVFGFPKPSCRSNSVRLSPASDRRRGRSLGDRPADPVSYVPVCVGECGMNRFSRVVRTTRTAPAVRTHRDGVPNRDAWVRCRLYQNTFDSVFDFGPRAAGS